LCCGAGEQPKQPMEQGALKGASITLCAVIIGAAIGYAVREYTVPKAAPQTDDYFLSYGGKEGEEYAVYRMNRRNGQIIRFAHYKEAVRVEKLGGSVEYTYHKLTNLVTGEADRFVDSHDLPTWEMVHLKPGERPAPRNPRVFYEP